jgi:hypothetical protein
VAQVPTARMAVALGESRSSHSLVVIGWPVAGYEHDEDLRRVARILGEEPGFREYVIESLERIHEVVSEDWFPGWAPDELESFVADREKISDEQAEALFLITHGEIETDRLIVGLEAVAGLKGISVPRLGRLMSEIAAKSHSMDRESPCGVSWFRTGVGELDRRYRLNNPEYVAPIRRGLIRRKRQNTSKSSRGDGSH